jgi:hypothetical protein
MQMQESDKDKGKELEKGAITRRDALKRMGTLGLGVFGVVAASSCDLFYEDYSDYSDYSDYYVEYYDNYVEYYNYGAY